MTKIIAAINMTLDGYCNHTAMIADDELQQLYNELLRNAGTILYGKITYQLMEKHWPTIVKNPTGNKATDVLIDNISKIVFSHKLKNADPIITGWKNVKLAQRNIRDEVLQLRNEAGKDILIGSRSLIVILLNLNLIDEFQICVHPIIIGEGLPLIKNINDRINLKLLKSKNFGNGSIVLYYKPVKK
jgi:dihydrofolate reductase